MYHKDIPYLLFVQIPAIFVIEDFVGQYLKGIQVLSVKLMQNWRLESKKVCVTKYVHQEKQKPMHSPQF